LGRRVRPAALALFVLLFALPKFTSAQAGNQRPLITQAVNENKLTQLTGNTHPLAPAEFDRGPAPPSLPMQRMLLVLSRSPQQETALQTLLQEQQDKSSPSCHKWLTPNEFGQQYGPSTQDIQTVAAWLASHGFQVAGVSNGRTVIEFSGTAAQVQDAFHTSIHSYVINGNEHWANASDPLIPSALAPVVVGVDTLNNFRRKAMHENVRVVSKSPQTAQPNQITPLLTFQCGTTNSGAPFYCNGVTPFDFATIYNVLPLWNATTPIDGTGQSIAIVGRSNINLQDVSDFRALFGLPSNPPQIILNGPDPGLVPGDETEADLDVEWSGAVARGATIKLVASESTETTDGVDLSALYTVDNNIAPIMSQSFLACELDLGTAGNRFYKNLWQQAAAQGITVLVSSGDQGSAGCDFLNGPPPQPAKNGLEVNGLASTPYNVAVGGTDFNDFSNPGLYWNLTGNSPTQESAKGYIPETTWNDSCTNAIWAQVGFNAGPEGNCNNSRISGSVFAVGGGGGKSNCTAPSGSTASTCSGGYAKPPWQTGTTVPTDGKRDLPDVSLFAADGFIGNFYVMCEADILSGSCNNSNFVSIGGTSVSSPAFAGLMALVDQKTAAQQGNPNFIFYKLAAAQSATTCNSTTGPASTCVFNDVTTGTIAMPCATGSLNCTTSISGDQYGVLSGYDAGAGYDLATGLGSVNATNLVDNWNSVIFKPSTTTLTLNGGKAINITHGAPISVSASVSPTSPQATGDVSLMATQGTNTFGFDTLTLSNGTASGTTSMLPGGTSYTVKAHYEGDGTYGGSDSNAVTVTVNPESSQTFANLVTLDINGNPTSFSASSGAYGSGSFLLRVDVGDSAASFSPSTGISSNCSKRITTCPTGTVALTANGAPLAGGSLPLNIEGSAEDQSLAPGTYAISANYPGDSSYGPSAATTNFTISKAPTTVVAGVAGLPVQYGNDEQIAATILTTSNGVAPTGTVSFSLDGSPLTTTSPLGYEGFPYNPNGSPPYATLSGTGLATFPSLGNHTLAAQYSGDANYAPATSAPATITVTQALPFFTTYGASPSSVNIGQQVTLLATIFGSDAGVAPTGTVTFHDGNAMISGTVTYTPLAHGLNVTLPYTPTAPGAHQISANYSGDTNYLPVTTPVPASLTVLGPDFSVASSGITSQTVAAGQTASFANAISVSPQDGFSAQVNLSCTIAAAATTCSVNPPSLFPGTGSATVTVTTTAHGIVPPPVSNDRFIYRPQLLPLSLVVLLVVLFLARASTSRKRLAGAVPLLAIALFLAMGAAIGCGGGSSTIPPPPPPPSGTQPGSYTITVIGASGTLTHTTTLTLLIN